MDAHARLNSGGSDSDLEDDLADDDVECERLCRSAIHNDCTHRKESIQLELKLPSDTYSGALLAILKIADSASRCAKERATLWMKLVLAVCLQLATILVQLTLTFMIYTYPIQAEEDPYNRGLAAKIGLLEHAVNTSHPLETADLLARQTLNLCQRDNTVEFSESVVIFLWSLQMLSGAASSIWMAVVCYIIPDVGVVGYSAAKSKGFSAMYSMMDFIEDDQVVIRALTGRIRWTIICVIMFPKLMVSVVLWIIGAKFIFFAPNMAQLILKASGMVLMTSVAPWPLDALSSRCADSDVPRSCFQYHVPRSSHRWRAMSSSTFRIGTTFALTLIFTRVYYGQVQTFRQNCQDYKDMFGIPCTDCGLNSHQQLAFSRNFTPWWYE